MKRTLFLLRFAGGIPLFMLAVFLRLRDLYVLSFIVMFLLTILEAGAVLAESRNILDFRFLLTLSWLGGLSLAVLNLSELQSDWSMKMWFTVGGFYFLMNAGYESAPFLTEKLKESQKGKEESRERLTKELVSLRVFQCIIGLFVLILGSFMIESVVFDFVYPILSDKPHAYTAFHITGIHYFVVSTPFIHALSVYYLMKGKPDRNHVVLVAAVNALCLVIAVLILSKLQLFFGLVMAFCVWFSLKKNWDRKQLLRILAVGGVSFAFVAFAMIFLRKYPENYLQGIFRFRNSKTPVPVQYVYIYVVNNFENLNLLSSSMSGFTLGKRILYPFFCLSGIKFLPQAAAFMQVEMFHTCEELTTLTILYDVYGDFGAAGVYLFALLLGLLCYLVTEKKEEGRIGGLLLHSQLVIYITLSFFSVWFSNPTTWYYFALTLVIAWWCKRKDRRSKKEKRG